MSIKDIALKLGVAPSTVSRALNGNSGVGKALREKIKAMALKLNYKPNPFAVGLVKQTPHIIGIIIPDIVTHFYSSIISGIGDTARANGYSVVITTSYEQYELEKHCIDDLNNIRVEGIIACLSQETSDYKHFENVVNQGVPLVFFDRVCLTDRCSSVVADNERSAYQAVQHLIANGYKRIAYIGGNEHLNIVDQRRRGYVRALADNCLPVYSDLMVDNLPMTYKSGRKAVRQLLALRRRPDAILAINDILAFGAMSEIKSRNLQIPTDIGLVGYSDELHATFVEPALTTVTHHTYEIGSVACDLLLRRINDATVKPKSVVIPTFLKIRASTAKRR